MSYQNYSVVNGQVVSPSGETEKRSAGMEEVDGTNMRRPEDLTPRELQILQLVWAGNTSRRIAEQLQISVKTAEAHRSNMMKKLRVSNTAQLLKVALETGILRSEDGAE
ncbi:MAG: hypothetical protein KF814_16645 [Nitrospiraceae bacterium]|nr:hypothetical protein [Nitrospiraceae bacterium]